MAGGLDPIRRLVPVLWAPLAGAGVKYPPGLREALDSATEPDYADNGLCALLRLQPYHDLYQAVVDRMGAQIVEIAERDPIEPVEPEQGRRHREGAERVPGRQAAPGLLASRSPPRRRPARRGTAICSVYGDNSADWRPFAGPGAFARGIRPAGHRAVRLRCPR